MKKLILLLAITSLLSCKDETEIEEVSQVYHQTFEVEDDFTWSEISNAYDLNGDSINDITVSTRFDRLDPDFAAEMTITATNEIGSRFAFLVDQGDAGFERQVGDIISATNTFNFSSEYKIILNSNYFDFEDDTYDAFYLAYEIGNTSRPSYGWMRLDFFQMKEFATNLNPGADLIVGETN